MPAAPDTEVLLERRSRDVGDRHTATLSFMPEPGIEVVGKLDGRAAHGYASIPVAITEQIRRCRLRLTLPRPL